MKWDDASEKILVTMLGHLGFEIEVVRSEGDEGLCLNIVSEDKDCLIGNNGDRLEDIQYLVNRILQRHFPDAPRVKVDCDDCRKKQEDDLIERVRGLAERAKKEGKMMRTRPLNAYYRRLVHHALADDPGVTTQSPKQAGRYKRIEIRPVS